LDATSEYLVSKPVVQLGLDFLLLG
jgi:hypothetical protein